MFNIKCARRSLINTRPLLFPAYWGEQRPFTPERLMLGVKWFHTHTRILHVTTATTPPAAITPASWFMGCERVMRWRWWGAVLFYDNAVPLYSHKWREWETRSEGEEREQTQPPLHPRGCFFFSRLLWDTVLLFQPTGSKCRQNGNLYWNNCSKCACPLVKGQWRSEQQQSHDGWKYQ